MLTPIEQNLTKIFTNNYITLISMLQIFGFLFLFFIFINVFVTQIAKQRVSISCPRINILQRLLFVLVQSTCPNLFGHMTHYCIR